MERAPRRDVSHDEGGNDPTECRECLAADLASASSSDPRDDGARRSTETMSECGHGHDLRSWICDAVGNHMISQQKHDVLDVNYFEGVENQLQGQHNWVHEGLLLEEI